MRATKLSLPVTLSFLVVLGAAADADAARRGKDKSFLSSDDYKEGEEVVGKFFGDGEYGQMVEDIERNDVEFDWGWVKATGGKPEEPGPLAFDVSSYQTISIAEVPNHHVGLVPDALPGEVREAFVQAMTQMGLEVVSGSADLSLEMALVDYKEDSTFAYVATIKPFLELEIRLRDNAADETLLLVRNQAHGDTPGVAARRFAELLMRFLR